MVKKVILEPHQGEYRKINIRPTITSSICLYEIQSPNKKFTVRVNNLNVPQNNSRDVKLSILLF
ncbi:MAG: hypothetical protein ACTSYC_05030 [Promethearchaeota archaeon]